MLMAALPPNRTSISSELNDMARLREAAAARGAKDREWQQMLNVRPTMPPLTGSPAAAMLKEDLSVATLPLGSDDYTSPRPSDASSPIIPSPIPAAPPSQGRRARQSKGVGKRTGKIRRHRLAKETEAQLNAAVQENDLTGTTAAQSRKMTPVQRDIMLHKRRLRNRASAARSREKQRKTITDLTGDIDLLNDRAEQISKSAASLQATVNAITVERDELRAENERLRRENESLRGTRPANTASLSGNIFPPGLGRNSSFLQLSLSTDQLEALNPSNSDGALFNNPASSLLRIPSLGILRSLSEQKPPRRTDSVLDRVLEGTVKGSSMDMQDSNPILTSSVSQ